MEKVNKSFYSILPAVVRYDKELSNFEKLLYSEITALANAEGFCWASNSYFSKLYDKNDKWVSVCINKLEKKGYIWIECGKSRSRKIYITPKGINDLPIKTKKKEKKEKVKPDKECFELAELLHNKILENHKNLRVQYDENKWADVFRKIIEIDNYKEEIIKQVILFCQWDKFWKKNILSANKFRQKFNTLLAQTPDTFLQQNSIKANENELKYEVIRKFDKETNRVTISKRYYKEKEGKKIYVDGRQKTIKQS